MSVGAFLKSKHYTHQTLVNLKKTAKSVVLNGEWVYLKTGIKAGDELRIFVSEETDSLKILPCVCKLDIVYEDEDLVIVNKPSNMPIHPSLNHYENTLANALMDYYQKQGKHFVFRCINRLDRDTTGLTMIAKHYLSAGILYSQMEKREIKRSYVAFCEGMHVEDGFQEITLRDLRVSKRTEESISKASGGEFSKSFAENFLKTWNGKFPRSGRIDLPIYRADASLIKRCVNENGERAITNYRHVKKTNGIDVMEFRLETGRTHQIRVHMSSLGYPLLGDELYGGSCEKIKRTALHAAKLEFRHPITQENITVEAKLHTDMLELCDVSTNAATAAANM